MNASVKICKYCHQNPSRYQYKWKGEFSKSVSEMRAIIRLGHLLEGDTEDLPSFKITNFAIYDKKGHFCTFDEGLIEKSVELFASGFIKNIEDEDPTTNSGVPSHDIGPIDEWFTAGYDGGKNILIGFQTKLAGYYLVQPNYRYKEPYLPFYNKIKVSDIILDYLIKQEWENPSYGQLIQHLVLKLDIDEEYVLRNGHFICNRIREYDNSSRTEDQMLISLSCMRSLIELSNYEITRIPQIKTGYAPDDKHFRKNTKATTTKLVYDLFEKLFQQIKITDKTQACGVCTECQNLDCGECVNCKSMPKFGGKGNHNLTCRKKRCKAWVDSDSDSDESVSESEDDSGTDKDFYYRKPNLCSYKILHEVRFFEKPIQIFDDLEYYTAAQVGNMMVELDSFVILNSEKVNEPQIVCQVKRIYRNGKDMFHGQLFGRGSDTVLGETSDPRELFVFNICFDLPLGSIVGLTDVEFFQQFGDWHELGGGLNEPYRSKCSFYFSKRYNPDFCTFTYYEPEKIESVSGNCDNCIRLDRYSELNKPYYQSDTETLLWKNEEFKVGDFIYYIEKNKPESCFQRKHKKSNTRYRFSRSEYYRKSNFIKGSNRDTNSAYSIGCLKSIVDRENNISFVIQRFIRPENIFKQIAYIQDWYHIYITDEIVGVKVKESQVIGKCYVTYDSAKHGAKWCEKGPNRFYYSKLYSPSTGDFREIPDHLILGNAGISEKWPKLKTKLKCFDLFSGCGGLSLGLSQAGLIETKWAVEKDPNTCHAFKLNNPDCKCFNNDCNYILQKAMSPSSDKLGIPSKNEVDIIVGGPPCQGFCTMNRFNKSLYSRFKNSLVVTLLSFVDFYRPKYFILENVMSFVFYMNGMVLKLFLKCLLDIGYQVTCSVMQAGQYGVPQNRRRFILIAAAPGVNLPCFPEPQHCFNDRGCHLSFTVDNIRYHNKFQNYSSAPYRTLTVYDAISDLPQIKNQNKVQNNLLYNAKTEYQRRMRRKTGNLLTNHIVKNLSPLTIARIGLVPKIPGADWRDLPNIIYLLSDGQFTNILQYSYRHKDQHPDEPNRSVCRCSFSVKCNPKDRQENTIIPWSFVHTANKQNHWSGIYGRLEWDGFFSTTLTKPEPSSKQGRVLHPTEDRIVSIRECARSQGLPDHHHVFGSITEKYRQIGNAVPPPLAYYIGMEIIKSYKISL